MSWRVLIRELGEVPHLFLLAATLDLYLIRRTRMMTSAMKKRVSTTPIRIPSTGVNSSGTGLSAEM